MTVSVAFRRKIKKLNPHLNRLKKESWAKEIALLVVSKTCQVFRIQVSFKRLLNFIMDPFLMSTCFNLRTIDFQLLIQIPMAILKVKT